MIYLSNQIAPPDHQPQVHLMNSSRFFTRRMGSVSFHKPSNRKRFGAAAEETLTGIRLRLLKVAATVNVRRVYVRMAGALTLQEVFATALSRLVT